jgi:hypothetical protein
MTNTLGLAYGVRLSVAAGGTAIGSDVDCFVVGDRVLVHSTPLRPLGRSE